MIDPKEHLPFWMGGTEVGKLAAAVQVFWQRLEDWLAEALTETDISVCSVQALELYAWERGITRLPGESEALWRGRVLHALTSSIESGSRKGLEAILAVHGVLNFSVQERLPNTDWDIVEIGLDPDSLSTNTEVLDRVMIEWGRVCRRYTYAHTTTLPVWHMAFPVDELHQVEVAA